MHETVVGIVEEVINNGVGKGSGVRVGGTKYGVYDPADGGLDSISVGTTISFQYSEKENGNLPPYKNVRGVLTTVKDGTPVSAIPPAVATGGASKGGFRKNGEEGGFPLHARCYERALDRRNALNAAVSILSASAAVPVVATIIDMAREFEEYTTGDDITNAQSTLSPEDMMHALVDDE